MAINDNLRLYWLRFSVFIVYIIKYFINIIKYFINRKKRMNFLDLTRNRYSCRSYPPRVLEQQKLAYIMECVRMAPSAVNRQPWRFRVLTSEDDRRKICACYQRDWIKTAPVVIIASVLHNEEWVRADGKHHGDIDVAIAVEHLCLAATEQGLATCWVCNFDAELCKTSFSLAPNEEATVLIPLGYAQDELRAKTRKDLKEILS